MNQISNSRIEPDLDKIRQIVDGQSLPNFVSGFELASGEFDGEPAVWVIFTTRPRTKGSRQNLDQRVIQMNKLAHTVRAEILGDANAPFPYFRFKDTDPTELPDS